MATGTREDTAIATIKIRMREPLRAEIERAAADHKQSMNSEMVSRLRRSFDEEDRDAALGGPELREIAYDMAASFGSEGTIHSASLGRSRDPAVWLKDPDTYFAAMLRVIELLVALHPEHKLSDLEIQAIFGRLASMKKRAEVDGIPWQ
jgi:hypothetical protein